MRGLNLTFTRVIVYRNEFSVIRQLSEDVCSQVFVPLMNLVLIYLSLWYTLDQTCPYHHHLPVLFVYLAAIVRFHYFSFPQQKKWFFCFCKIRRKVLIKIFWICRIYGIWGRYVQVWLLIVPKERFESVFFSYSVIFVWKKNKKIQFFEFVEL